MTALPADLQKEDKGLEGWPRRLLHVPSMTSHVWQPGHDYVHGDPFLAKKYPKYQMPEYNAITYTWGRFRLPTDVEPHIRAIDIMGVPWSVPRIKDTHFTREEFSELMRTVVTAFPVDFIWLDIACIDQRPNQPVPMAEIGRQAMIFKGAKCVYAWLTTFDTDRLCSVMSNITDAYFNDDWVLAKSSADLLKSFSEFSQTLGLPPCGRHKKPSYVKMPFCCRKEV
ncbi:MAG: hypothetical protein M1821_007751 [Bathelium mastoideum]|nr:MAG: hypothetical protein M1821_007751 [Bathelium mastoideum]